MFETILEKYRYYRDKADAFYQRIFKHGEPLNRLEKVAKYSITAYRTNNNREIGVKCAALVYYTAFAIVPILALIFSVIDSLGFDQALMALLEFFIPDQPDSIDTVFSLAEGAKINPNAGILAIISSMFLFWSIWTLMDRVSMVFKELWKNHTKKEENRTWWKRAVSRISLLLFAPFVIIIMYAGVTQITVIEAFFIKADFMKKVPILPEFFNVFNYMIMYAGIAVVFSAMYKYIPSVKVKLRHALVSGAVSGLAFIIFQLFYIYVQSKVSNYNQVYGALAALPLFLLWAYYSWELIIKGAVLCYTLEYPDEYDKLEEAKPEPTIVGSIKDKIIKDVKTLQADITTAVENKIQDMKEKRESRKNKN